MVQPCMDFILLAVLCLIGCLWITSVYDPLKIFIMSGDYIYNV